MTETEIKEIVQKQRSYFYTGATLPVEKRLDALKKLKTCIQKYEPLINEALKRDLGKSNFESYMCEVGLTLSELRYVRRHVKSWSRNRRVHTPLAQFHAASFTVQELHDPPYTFLCKRKNSTDSPCPVRFQKL